MDYLEALQQARKEIAEQTGRDWSSLVPWVDYDPILLDSRTRELINPGIRWTGD